MNGGDFLSVSLKNYHDEIKPRARGERNGIESLSYQELLAIILRTGSKDKNVLELSNEILGYFDSLFEFKTASLEELTEIKGIGPVKAIELQASIELGRRLANEQQEKKGKIVSSVDLGEKLILEMKDFQQEHFVVLYLNTKNELIKKRTIFIGSLNQSIAHPREVFKIGVKCSAARIILCHNHPSGDPEPSEQDIQFTKRMVECGKVMGITVLDHFIIGEKTYVSLLEEGEM